MKRGDVRLMQFLSKIENEGYSSIDEYCNVNGLNYTDVLEDPDSPRYNEEVDDDDNW